MALLVSADRNTVIPIAPAFSFGRANILLETLAATLYHTCYFVWYLRKNIIKSPVDYYLRYLIPDMMVIAAAYLAFREPELPAATCRGWLAKSILVQEYVLLVSLPVYGLMNRLIAGFSGAAQER